MDASAAGGGVVEAGTFHYDVASDHRNDARLGLQKMGLYLFGNRGQH